MNKLQSLRAIFAQFQKRAFAKSCEASAALFTFLVTSPLLGHAIDISEQSGISDWPWTRFLNSLAEQLTGPLPKILGILGIAVAAIGMFMGNHGAGMQKMLVLIFAVSICLFAPSFINYISTGATSKTNGLTIFVSMM